MSLAGIGDNSAGIDAATQISDNLRERNPDLVKRASELADMKDRVPASVDNEDDANEISTAIRQCAAFEKASEGARVGEKEPYLAGGRAVDGFFQNLAKPVTAVKTSLLRVRTAYDMAVADRERKRRQEEAAKAAEEAARLARDAETAREKTQAAVAVAVAEDAHQATRVKPAELTRTRTDEGVVTSLRSEWRHEVIDPALVPREYCVPEDRLLRAAVKAATTKAGQCLLEIPGVRIFEHHASQVR